VDGSSFLDGFAAGWTLPEQFRAAVFAQQLLCIVGCVGALWANGIKHGASPSRFRFLDGFYQVMSRESSFIFNALSFSGNRRLPQGLSGLCFFRFGEGLPAGNSFPGL